MFGLNYHKNYIKLLKTRPKGLLRSLNQKAQIGHLAPIKLEMIFLLKCIKNDFYNKNSLGMIFSY